MRAFATFAAILFAPTLAAGLTITEGPPIGDYASRTVLPANTDLVFGAVTLVVFGTDIIVDNDYFALTDLLPGATFTLTVEKLENHPVNFTVLDGLAGVLIPTFTLPGEQGAVPPTVVFGTVPLSGEIVMQVKGNAPYVIGIAALRVPEPGAAALLALGFGALLRGRR